MFNTPYVSSHGSAPLPPCERSRVARQQRKRERFSSVVDWAALRLLDHRWKRTQTVGIIALSGEPTCWMTSQSKRQNTHSVANACGVTGTHSEDPD
jgi:hypothetical protein